MTYFYAQLFAMDAEIRAMFCSRPTWMCSADVSSAPSAKSPPPKGAIHYDLAPKTSQAV